MNAHLKQSVTSVFHISVLSIFAKESFHSLVMILVLKILRSKIMKMKFSFIKLGVNVNIFVIFLLVFEQESTLSTR